jgi:hypothetical protein
MKGTMNIYNIPHCSLIFTVASHSTFLAAWKWRRADTQTGTFLRYRHPSCLSFVEVEVNLRPTVSLPICLGVRRPPGTRDRFFFLLEISFRQLRLCYFVASSLTRGRVGNLLYNCFWAFPEQSLLGRSPAELTTIFYCLIWDSPNLESQVPVFISPRNRVAQLYPRTLGSLFVASYNS